MASAAGGVTPPAIPNVTYEPHMSHIHEHSILIDTEHAAINAEKKRVQAIQKAEHDHLEVNSSNTTSGHGNSRHTGGQGGDSHGRNND